MSFTTIAGKYKKSDFYNATGFYRQLIYKKRMLKLVKDTIETEVVDSVLKVRKRFKRLGGRRIFYKFTISIVGINKFEKIISANGLGVKIRKKHIKTTHGLYEESDKNLINGLHLNDINQVVAGDITYLILKNKTFYIYTLKDMYSKRIIGLHGSDNLFADNAIVTLNQALSLRGKSIGNCIHHTDAGSQYKSNAYKTLLQNHKLRQSIAENCLQNGMAEQLNGTIKNDYLPEKISSVSELNRVLKKVKKDLNEEIPVKELGYRTPVQFENDIKLIPKERRRILKLYDFTINK
jgi:putative transposase